MRVCRQYGIPHGQFKGGPGWWSDTDRDKALAYELLLREECPKCGTLAEDWQDSETKRPLMDPVWAAVPMKCYGCDEVDRLQEDMDRYARKSKSGGLRGVRIVFVPFDQLDDWEPTEGEVAPDVPEDLAELRKP